MNTILTTSPKAAAKILLNNELVAFPTETVFGLGANAFEPSAVKKIFIAKGRPFDNPLIVHVAEKKQIVSVVASIPRYAEKLMDNFFPGALTIVLPRHKNISREVSAGLNTVGVRIPNHSIAKKFLTACGVPIAAPSANLSGKPSPTMWQDVRTDLDGRIACILKGAATTIGVESTVVDCTGTSPIILRSGGVTLEQLREIIPTIRLSKQHRSTVPKSPGMKYRHYAPNAYIFLVANVQETVPMKNSAYIGVHGVGRKTFGLKKICRTVNEYARSIFHFFRECDKHGIETIYCESVSEDGLGLALMDRIRKAALQ